MLKEEVISHILVCLRLDYNGGEVKLILLNYLALEVSPM